MEREIDEGRLVIFAPHPDDEWIGCGCSILKCRDHKVPVKVILVTSRLEWRVKRAKELAQKYDYELVLLNQEEFNINGQLLREACIKEIKPDDVVFIPPCDNHPDHRFIHRIVSTTIQNKHLYEYAIYNNASNLFTKLKNKFHAIKTGATIPSFTHGTGKTLKYKSETKIKNIQSYKEYPREIDVFRKIPLTKRRSKRKYNIAFLTKDYPVGTVDAGFTSIMSLAKQLKEQGHFVALISNKGYASWYEKAADKSYEEFQGIPIYRPYGLKWFNVEKWHINPATLFNRLIAPALGVRYVQKKLGIKFHIIHHSSAAPYMFAAAILAGFFAPTARLFQTIRAETVYGLWGYKLSKLLNWADAVFVPLKSLADTIVADGCDQKRIRIMHSAISLKQMQKLHQEPSVLRRQYEVGPDDKVVLYYGKSGHYKGVDILLQSIKFIPKTEKIKFLFFHPVIWLPEFVKLAEESKNKDKIRMSVGKISVPDHLNMADVLVLPYRSLKGTEANPLCLLEGMASATPIITTEIPELKELVEKDKDVVMVQPENPEALAKEILKLLKDRKRGQLLADNAYSTVKKFDISYISDRHMDVYDSSMCKYRRGLYS